MNLLARNYDLVATVSTAGVLLITRAPWPFWALWTAVAAYQVGNRTIRGWRR